MGKIKGKNLIKLGFEKQVENQTLNNDGYHYYTYDINSETILITCASDEKICGGYFIEFYDDNMGLKIVNLKDLKRLVKILKGAGE